MGDNLRVQFLPHRRRPKPRLPKWSNGQLMNTPAGQLTAPDRTAIEVARAVQSALAPDKVILFGSRARGDHRPNSDVDLLIISESGAVVAAGEARRAAREHFRLNPPRLRVDVVTMNVQRFNYCRRAKNHVAAQAFRDGVLMSDENFDISGRHEDGYPDSWPDVRERLQAAYRHIRAFHRLVDFDEIDQEMYGFHAQQAVENAIKAWLSAADLEYRSVHDLREVANQILADPAEANTLAAAQLRSLIGYTSFQNRDRPGEQDNWLTRYAVSYRYSGASFRMDDIDKDRFVREINLAVGTFINRAYELTGTDESDVMQG
jgi:predicted nucleotidyltransferase